MSDRFPKAYTAEVRRDDSLMQYVTFDSMGIGARRSGLPKKGGDIVKTLEHVGKSASGKGK